MSKKLEHTKGEWIASASTEVDSPNAIDKYEILVQDNPNTFDEDGDPDLSGIVLAELCQEGESEESEANARLMAAAPNLLAACLKQEQADNYVSPMTTLEKLKKEAKHMRKQAIQKAIEGVEGVSI